MERGGAGKGERPLQGDGGGIRGCLREHRGDVYWFLESRRQFLGMMTSIQVGKIFWDDDFHSKQKDLSLLRR